MKTYEMLRDSGFREYLIMHHSKDKLVSEYEMDWRFNEILNQTLEKWELGTIEYEPSDILKSVDPVCYRQEFLNYVDSEGYEECDDYYILQSDIEDLYEEYLESKE